MENGFSHSPSSMIGRRTFIGLPLVAIASRAAAGAAAEPVRAEQKRIAAIMTSFWRMSHAEVFVGRLLEGYHYNGERQSPRVKMISMYVDQFPENDMSRDKAKKHGIPICKTIREALTLGGKELAVDGVVIIGEHGNYAFNIKGQQLYPKFHFYKQVIDVFLATGRVAPVYCDKYISHDWDEAKWMYDQSVAMGFPLMAGSSLSLTWRRPELEFELETPVERAVAVNYGPKERYGTHLLESLQCMVERRKGGETGIAAVQCLEGSHVWKWTDDHPWAGRLLDAAIAQCPERKPGSLRKNVRQPILFILEYRSGLEAACYLLNGHITSGAFVAEVKGKDEPVSTHFFTPGRPYGHFSGLVHYFEEMILNGKTSYPVERTLLTTGALIALFDSSYENGQTTAPWSAGGANPEYYFDSSKENGQTVMPGRRVVTPHLEIAYRAQKESLFNRGPIDPAEPDFGIGP